MPKNEHLRTPNQNPKPGFEVSALNPELERRSKIVIPEVHDPLMLFLFDNQDEMVKKSQKSFL